MQITRTLILSVCVGILCLASSVIATDKSFTTDRSTRHFTRARTYDIQHQKLEITIDMDAGTITGRQTLTISSLNDGLEQLTLDAVGLTIDGITDADGRTLGHEVTDDHILIDLHRSVRGNEPFEIRIDYHATPRLGMYFNRPDKGYPDKPKQVWTQGEMHESAHWFPCYDFPNDVMTSEMIVTVPAGNMVISNGALLETTSNAKDGTVTYHWKESVPHVSYLTSVVVGEYRELKDEWDGIPIQSFVHPSEWDMAERSFSKTAAMMQFFSEKIGYRYPYEKYAQTTVHDFKWGGMENVSATTLTHRTLHDEAAHSDYQSDGLVAHELAHQWWGNLLTCKNWNHIWLNEGFATYFDKLFTEHDVGADEFQSRMDGSRESYFKEDSTKYRRSIVTDKYENAADMFDSHTYSKGACVLHMIRYILGDELWWKSVNHYANTFHGHPVETADLRQAIEDVTGNPMDWFFDQWVYSGGHPEYELDWSWNARAKMVTLHVNQVQTVDDMTPLFRMPVEVHVTTESGVQQFRLDIENDRETFQFPVDAKPKMIEFDPSDWVLKQLSFKKTLAERVYQLEHGQTMNSRARAALALADHAGDSKATKALRYCLHKEPFWDVRTRAAEALGKIKTGRAKEALLSALDDSDSRVRREVIKALGKFKGDRKVEKALAKSLNNDESYYARSEAVKALAAMEAKSGYTYCVSALKQSSFNETVRAGAMSALVKLKTPRGIDHAMKWTEYGLPQHARRAAVKALAGLAEFDEDREDEIRERIIELLEDPSYRMRKAAIAALGDLGDSDAISALERSIAREPDYACHKAARKAIRKINEAAEPNVASLKSDIETLKADQKELQETIKRLTETLENDSAGGGTGSSSIR